MYTLTLILVLLIIILLVIYLYRTRNFGYWRKRGVTYEKPSFFISGLSKSHITKVRYSKRFADLHRGYPNKKFVGFFEGTTPSILLRDPELIKRVLVTDFRYFHRREMFSNKAVMYASMKHLYTANGDIWNLMRRNLTPAFSPSKLEAMFPLIVETTERLTRIVNEFAESEEEVATRDLMLGYTLDFIHSCGFGVGSHILNEVKLDFGRPRRCVCLKTIRSNCVWLLQFMFPNWFAPDFGNTISKVKRMMAQRDYKPCGRNDFIDSLLELKERGKIVGESIECRNSDGTPEIVELDLDNHLLATQVLIFWTIGLDACLSASSFVLQLLAYKREEQECCRTEIDQVLQNYDGKLCYDAVMDMKYLEMVLKECLRLFQYPGYLLRSTCDKYQIPGTDVMIDEGTPVAISVEALCADERFFKDPGEFKPERFHPDNSGSIEECVYLPFGNGPRGCVGERMGVMHVMAGVAAILKNFTVGPARENHISIRHRSPAADGDGDPGQDHHVSQECLIPLVT